MVFKSVRDWLEAPAASVAERGGRLNVLRGAVARVTTPLLPDDYLHLANPLWSARSCADASSTCARRPLIRRPW